MRELKTEIKIHATADKVWNVLTEFRTYSEWNPFIRYLSGFAKVGHQLTATMQLPTGKPMTFKPVVLKVMENKELRWKGKLFVKGVFDGEHYFILSENDDNTTTLFHGEICSGILIPLIGKVLDKTEEGFRLMNNALKEMCEKDI